MKARVMPSLFNPNPLGSNEYPKKGLMNISGSKPLRKQATNFPEILNQETLAEIPPLTPSEHHIRVSDWANSLRPTFDDHGTLIDDDRNNALIDEGVEKLRNREQQITGPQQSFDLATAKVWPDDQRSQARKVVIEELKKIKQKIDPDDHITSRAIVEEFGKFMNGKKQGGIKTGNRPATMADRRVQFLSEDEKTRKPSEIGNVPFTINYSANPARNIVKNVDRQRDSELEQKRQEELRRNKSPAWWKRKIRQGEMQTDEMLNKLLKQPKFQETSAQKHDILQEIYDSDPDIGRARTFGPLSAKITRAMRERLDTSLDRMKQRHEDCFGPSCPLLKDEEEVDKKEKEKKPKSSAGKYKSPTDNFKSLLSPIAKKDPIASPTGLASQNTVVHSGLSKIDYVTKMLSLHRASNPTDSNFVQNVKSALDKRPKSSKTLEKGLLKPFLEDSIEVIFDRRNSSVPLVEPENSYDKVVPFGSKAGITAERWNKSYLQSTTSQSQPPVQPQHYYDRPVNDLPSPVQEKSFTSDNEDSGAEGLPAEDPQPANPLPLPHQKPEFLNYNPNKHSNSKHKAHLTLVKGMKPVASLTQKAATRNEWVRKFIVTQKSKPNKLRAEAHARVVKQRAATNELYHELILNKNRLQTDVGLERRKIQTAWRVDAPWKIEKEVLFGENSKLPDRFKPIKDDGSLAGVRKGPVTPLRINWDEKPRGLGIWLDDVLAKAKEDKDIKDKKHHKHDTIPLKKFPL